MITKGLTSRLTSQLTSNIDGYIIDNISPNIFIPLSNSLSSSRGNVNPTFTRDTTGTYIGSSGLIKTAAIDVPRFQDGGILIEPSSTNLLTYSDDFHDSSWIKGGGSSVTSNQAISPDGTMNADLVYVPNGAGYIYKTFAYTSGAAYTYSIWLRSVSGAGTYTLNWYDNLSGHQRQNVNLTEEWQRFSIDIWITSGATTVFIYLGDDRGSIGDLEYVYAWGAQVEEGATATSYISTSASSVTRTSDNLNYDVEDVITQGIGSWYCEFKYSYSTGYPRVFELTDTTSSNTIIVRITNTKYFGVLVTTGGVNQVTINTTSTLTDNTLYKMCLTYSRDNVRLYLNGVLVGYDLSCTIPELLKLTLGSTRIGTGQLNGYIKNFKYYNSVLTQEQSERMTS